MPAKGGQKPLPAFFFVHCNDQQITNMKKILLIFLFSALTFLAEAQDTSHHKLSDTLMLDNIELTPIRAEDQLSFTITNLN